jgi:hypothetical protein
VSDYVEAKRLKRMQKAAIDAAYRAEAKLLARLKAKRELIVRLEKSSWAEGIENRP